MRRLARAYQARLNFYLIDRGELPDYEGAAAGTGEDGRGVVVGAVSALRAKQPFDFTFDPHSELSVEKLKDWIDQFLAGKLKKVATVYLSVVALVVSRCSSTHSAMLAFCCHRRDHRSQSCRTVTRCRSTTKSEPFTSMTSQSGTKLWATSTLLCSRCAGRQHCHLSLAAVLDVCAVAFALVETAGASVRVGSTQPRFALQHGPSARGDR